MNQRRIQIVILCEDRQQEVFARYFLKKRGFTGNIRTKFCRKGAGEQFVRKSYATEVKVFRSKNYISGILVVLIDADNASVSATLKELDDALIKNSLTPRQPDEAIAIFVPKRNIETWIHYLQGTSVDENSEKPYPKFPKHESACKPYVENLADKCREGNLETNAPPSLQAACGELQRILGLLR